MGKIMDLDEGAKLKRFIIRVVVTTLAILIILFFVKIWFFNNKAKTPDFKQQAPISISLNDVTKYYGKYVIVEGKITKTYNSGKACFLNFNVNYRRYLTAVIFASSFSQFPPNPENYYLNKTVKVVGTIKEYQGSPEIILNNKEQIEEGQTPY
ncbi:MAG: hypothetical protein ABH873_08110 [Candidatus Firestonebacteria bacterium]